MRYAALILSGLLVASGPSSAWAQGAEYPVTLIYRNFGYPFADQANGGSIRGMLDAIDLIDRIAGPDTTPIPGHGTLIKKDSLRACRAMLVDIMAG